jgi:anti-sigma regulatory factor (Ser/Thr protein kinase)
MAGVWRLLLAKPEAVTAARHAVGQLDGVDGSVRSVLELLTSELVSNAVKHGSSDPHESILVSAHCVDDTVCVMVCDEGGGGFEERPPQGDPLVPGGNGLLLVDTLASRWGVEPGNPTCVWFEAEPARVAG